MALGVASVNPHTAGGTTRNQRTLEEMETLEGHDQVPFLVDSQHGVELDERDDSADHLEAHSG